MVKPVRIQLRRTKGFRLQEVSRAINGLPAVNVARPSRWGNPFTREWFWGLYGESPEWRDDAVKWFCDMLASDSWRRSNNYPSIEEIRRDLRGKNLACWCPLDQPCHADVLLRIANGEAEI